ncbi:MAG: super-infection exclusion protein B [Candidatus ainarchaeum sp.]|nr:super-infection exclusion protein B [Candidatus ainarchaeum sp.]
MELKIDFSSKKTIAGLIALVCVIAIIAYLPAILISTNPQACTVDGVCEHEQRLNLLIDLVPVFVLAGIVIGAVIFFFMSSKLDNKQKEINKVTETLVQFLNRDEKTVVQKILENNGKVYQSEISRIEGIGKLKSHRILRRLSDRKVIEIEGHGKTNIVKLAKNIQEALIPK